MLDPNLNLANQIIFGISQMHSITQIYFQKTHHVIMTELHSLTLKSMNNTAWILDTY
jgi:hypothetical protein